VERKLGDDDFDEIVLYMRSFANRYQQKQTRKHTRNTFRDVAEKGYVTGNKIYGYNNVGPTGKKKRVPNEEEATIVREIWKRYANGEGFKSIAYDLNERGVPSPRPRKKPVGWEPSSIRSILTNRTYTGTAVYGRSRKAYGREMPKAKRETLKKMQLPVHDESEWITHKIEPLVDAKTAAAVQSKFDERKQEKKGKKRQPRNVRYLLSGILTCPCGAGFEAIKSGSWNSPNKTVYMCSARRRKEPSACSN
jgi:site-specific DNA recombinase